MDEKFKVGNFLASLRKEKGLTQIEVANFLNITEKAVSKWENGRCLPENKHLRKLSELYNVGVDEIICGERLKEKTNDDALLKVVDKNRAQQKAMKNIFTIFTTFIILNAIVTAITKNFIINDLSVCSGFYVIIACFCIIAWHGTNIDQSEKTSPRKHFFTALIIGLTIAATFTSLAVTVFKDYFLESYSVNFVNNTVIPIHELHTQEIYNLVIIGLFSIFLPMSISYVMFTKKNNYVLYYPILSLPFALIKDKSVFIKLIGGLFLTAITVVLSPLFAIDLTIKNLSKK